jgi:hypothetical protein
VGRGPTILLILLTGLMAGAGVMLGIGDRPRRPAGEFHRLTGGLGFGPAVVPDGCEFDFDPRLCPACAADSGPIPGGAVFCPHHGCSILEHPPLAPPEP